jgi:hypothetical protein
MEDVRRPRMDASISRRPRASEMRTLIAERAGIVSDVLERSELVSQYILVLRPRELRVLLARNGVDSSSVTELSELRRLAQSLSL